MFKDQFECYGAIGNALANAIPERWDEVRVESIFDGSSVDLLIMYTRQPDQREENLDYVPMLARYFYELARLVSTPEKGLYKTCRFKMNSEGKYDAQFEY